MFFTDIRCSISYALTNVNQALVLNGSIFITIGCIKKNFTVGKILLIQRASNVLIVILSSLARSGTSENIFYKIFYKTEFLT